MSRRIAASTALVAAAALITFGALPLLRGNLPAELAAGALALVFVVAASLSLAHMLGFRDSAAARMTGRRLPGAGPEDDGSSS